MRRKVVVNDRMQHGYVYYLSEPAGKHFAPEFTPELTPKQMLRLGVFGGKYLTDCRAEFPRDWFTSAKLSDTRRQARLNCGPPERPLKTKAKQSLFCWIAY